MPHLGFRSRFRRRRGRTSRSVVRRRHLQLLVAAGGLTLVVAAGLGQVQSLGSLLGERAPGTAVTPTAEQARFIDRVGGVAQRLHASVGLPPSLVTAMAINETGWGSSELCTRANNYFSIKADLSDGTTAHVLFDTREVLDGHVVVVRAPFRVYRSLEDSVQDLGAFLHANSRYDALWARARDPRASALALAQAGYATDPQWAAKLVGLIDTFGLDSLDTPAWRAD